METLQELKLNQLEQKISEMLSSLKDITRENSVLRHKLVEATHERDRLREKNKVASLKLKSIITRMRNEL